MELPSNIKDDIWNYCRLNDITDVDGFIVTLIKQGFDIEKYGVEPFKTNQQPEIVEKEIIKEVEVIREVEVIKEVEVPVEVIKEVEVEKIVEVEVSNDIELNEVLEKLVASQKESSTFLTGWEEKTKELDEANQTIKTLEEKGGEECVEKDKRIDRLEYELSGAREKLNKKTGGLFSGSKGNIINWISRDERDEDDDDKNLYGE